jgi:hypothetical protein
MKLVIALGLVLALVLPATLAFAQPAPPVNGVYRTTDLGGTMLSGRFSESWPGVPFHGQIGNTVNAASYDGAVLGTEWKLWCASIASPPMLVSDTRVNGTGVVTYQTLYSGGNFWLTQGGPWSADNAVNFTGTLDSFIAVTTFQYAAGTVIGIVSNITTSGFFDQLDPSWGMDCLEYTISNAAFAGDTSTGTKPAGYPDFLDPGLCPADTGNLMAGGWGLVTQVTLLISGCEVPLQPTSWGQLKALHR